MSQRDLVAELRAARIERTVRGPCPCAADRSRRHDARAAPHIHLAPRARRRAAGRGGGRSCDRRHAALPWPTDSGARRARRRRAAARRLSAAQQKSFSTPVAPPRRRRRACNGTALTSPCACARRAVSRPGSSARSRSPSRSAAMPARSTRPPPAQAGSADLTLKSRARTSRRRSPASRHRDDHRRAGRRPGSADAA